MRERGRYQLQLMKTRNSSGVGQKIDLGFNLDTLRIEDLGDDDDDGATSTTTGSNILDNIKRSNAPVQDPVSGSSAPKLKADADSTQLRNFINNLGTE
jgi:hypothetical protein